MSNIVQRISRFSDLEWASELRQIMLIGIGGIGSYLAYNLSRISHPLFIIDPDSVDESNTIGGQLYRTSDIGNTKVASIISVCRDFGCINEIDGIEEKYDKSLGMEDICITGLDNMEARKQSFEAWEEHSKSSAGKCLYIDGRLNAELWELLTVQSDNKSQIEKYKEEYLFDDSEVESLPCTAKQTSFAAMGIASNITAVLCNWLTNQKMGMEFRETPFYQRTYLPIFQHKKMEAEPIGKIVVEIIEEKIEKKPIKKAVKTKK